MRILLFLLLTATLVVTACEDNPSTVVENTENKISGPAAQVQEDASEAGPSNETVVQPPAAAKVEQPREARPGQPVSRPEHPAGKPVPVKTEPAPVPSDSPGSLDRPGSSIPVPEQVTAQPVEKQVVTTPVQVPVPTKKPESGQPPSHETWDQLLRQYVSATGKVNYAGLKKDKAKLEAYLDLLQKNPPQNEWPKGEKMAFWINAYNAFTVKLIVDHYPVSSIMKLDGGKPWDVKRMNAGGKSYSLNNIENDILRPQFKDARIHFAVNCAAKSCPPLLNRAWTAANLEADFEKQAKAFINNANFNKISSKEVELSKIFEWYAGDFGDLIAYLNKYASTKINANAKVKYREYDWGLNE